MFQVDGAPMLAPDKDVAVVRRDVESPDSGYDELGVYHPIILRRDVAVWTFRYSQLTDKERRYLEELFGEKTLFQFTYPGEDGLERTCTAYRGRREGAWQDAPTALWRDYGFDIMEY